MIGIHLLVVAQLNSALITGLWSHHVLAFAVRSWKVIVAHLLTTCCGWELAFVLAYQLVLEHAVQVWLATAIRVGCRVLRGVRGVSLIFNADGLHLVLDKLTVCYVVGANYALNNFLTG